MGEKGEQTKRKIKDEAYMIFAKQGYKAVTMKDICEVTGLSRGGLYRHYDSTFQIFSEILEELSGSQRDKFSEKIVRGMSAKVILEETLEQLRAEMLDSERSLSLAIYEFSNSHASNYMTDFYIRTKMSWGAFIQYGIDQEEFKKVNVDQVVDLILFAYQGVRMWSNVINMDQTIVESMVAQIKSILEVA